MDGWNVGRSGRQTKLLIKAPNRALKAIYVALLSQPNNNHKPNNKTTITVVGLRLSNRWETTTHHTNSKLHDRAEIEQNSENKTY